APSAINERGASTSCSNKGSTCEASSTSLSVKSNVTISPLFASRPICNLRQARRFAVPCFSNNHSPAPRKFQPRAVNDQVQVARSNPRPFGNRQSARPSAQRRMIRDGQVDLQHSHDRANQPFALAQRQSKHRSQCQSRLNGKIGIVRLAARRGSGLRLPTSQRFVGEPNREASTIAKRCVIVTPVRHSMPLTWNVASALGMEFERHDRSSRWQRRSSVAKLLKRPPRPYPCTKVTNARQSSKAESERSCPPAWPGIGHMKVRGLEDRSSANATASRKRVVSCMFRISFPSQ